MWGMLQLAVPWHEVAVEPPPENKLAGVIWIFFGWSVPAGMAVATGLLYTGWSHFRAVSRVAARGAALTVPLLAVGFGAVFVDPHELASVVLMDLALGVHFLAVLTLLGTAIGTGNSPWLEASEFGRLRSEGTAGRLLEASAFAGWLAAVVATVAHLSGRLLVAVSDPLAGRNALADVLTFCATFGAGVGALLAVASYLLLECREPSPEDGGDGWTRVARGSCVALLVSVLAVQFAGIWWKPLVLDAVEAVLVAVNVVSVATVTLSGRRR